MMETFRLLVRNIFLFNDIKYNDIKFNDILFFYSEDGTCILVNQRKRTNQQGISSLFLQNNFCFPNFSILLYCEDYSS